MRLPRCGLRPDDLWWGTGGLRVFFFRLRSKLIPVNAAGIYKRQENLRNFPLFHRSPDSEEWGRVAQFSPHNAPKEIFKKGFL